jgi:hypothetical protein
MMGMRWAVVDFLTTDKWKNPLPISPVLSDYFVH